MKRNYQGRRKLYRKRKQGKSKSKPSKAVRSYVKKQIHKNIENKGSTVQVNADAIPTVFTAPPYDLLANMYRSTSETVNTVNGQINQGMLGLQCRLRYLTINWSLMGQPLNNTNPSNTSMTRLIIVFDKQATNNTQLSLWGASNFDNLILQTNHITSPLQLGVKRYKVLYDKMIKITSAGTNIATGKIRINLKNTLLQYFPTTASFFELNKRLQLFVVGTNDQFSIPLQPTLQFFSRVVFEDA